MPDEKPNAETPYPDPHLISPPTELRDRRAKPEGVVNKQSQMYLIVALAVLILLAVMFSKSRVKSVPKPSADVASGFSSDANQQNIEELTHELAEQQKKGQSQYNSASSPQAAPTTTPPPAVAAPSSQTANNEPPRDPVKDAERALAFKSRFAPNLISRNESTGDGVRSPLSPAAAHGTEEGLESSSPVAAAQPSPTLSFNSAQQSPTEMKHPPEVNVNSAFGQPYVLFEGTTVDTALVNRLDGEFSGPVKVMVTDPIYSHDRQHILIPEGTFLIGQVQKVSGFGQKRLAVAFHRMLMPDGYSVDLDQFHGLDQTGETGLKDQVNNHYLQIFGASIALGVISGATQSTTNAGYNETGSDAWRQGVGSSLSQSSVNILDRFINIPPTLTIREGHRIKVYLTQDLLLPAYEKHTIAPNI